MNVQKVSFEGLGDPGPAMTFIFTMLTMEFWGIYAGIFTGPTILVVGICQIACFVPYLIGAIFYFVKGNGLMGCCFLIFATIFGSLGGGLNIFAGLANIFGWEYSNQMAYIPFIWGAAALLPINWCIRKICPAVTWICYVDAMFFLAGYGFVGLGVMPASLNVVLMWMALICAITGLWSMMSGLKALGSPDGKGYPCGPVLFK